MDAVVRAARIDDAAEIARLTGELGYPCSREQMATRLAQLLFQPNHFIAVASGGEMTLLGWVAAESRLLLESGRRTEITGLVIDSSRRRAGLGSRLLSAAESWARSCGQGAVVVRSNAARRESHPFYAKHGYATTKTQHVYRKQLS